MATTYKTPGVYINEVSTIPASVAQVATAIPAFVGYTEFAIDRNGDDLDNVPKRVSSMVEFEQFFGGSSNPVDELGSDSAPKITLDENNDHVVSSIDITLKFVLYQSMSLYFANGGGACYVVSVGDYSDYDLADSTMQAALTAGFVPISKEDEPTILLAPDAAFMENTTELGTLQKSMLVQCNQLKDRFCVFDLVEDTANNDLGESDFRTEVGMQYLKYGAAYGPWLETSLTYSLQYDDLVLEDGGGDLKNTGVFDATAEAAIIGVHDDLDAINAEESSSYIADFDLIASASTANLTDKMAKVLEAVTNMRALMNTSTNSDIEFSIAENVKTGTSLETIVRQVRAYAEGYDIIQGSSIQNTLFDLPLPAHPFDGVQLASIPGSYTISDFDYDITTGIIADGSIFTGANVGARVTAGTPFVKALLEDVLAIYTDIKAGIDTDRIFNLLEDAFIAVDPIYAGIQKAIGAQGVIIPSSGAVAGIYVATDANRGVWKAPANVSLSGVVKPTIKVDNASQESLNVDTIAGKSVNVIRSFTGKGVLVWGARTLAGNDNEWRYVPVRRLFNTIEESVKKATEFVVFEPNDGNTWLRTRTMIENYLTGLWRQGAIAGAKPADAFFVNCGLGTTMTAQDILEGKMIVEIGIAAVRPAEFIILRFSHKLQES
ncbi:MAG: phage tail sheath subtilisin-like domain-containing protein [Flavobacteriales bacterium]|nr:phage tail sheath subtilisin-like domain-containing protein [Flavobacteriales bacterium]